MEYRQGKKADDPLNVHQEDSQGDRRAKKQNDQGPEEQRPESRRLKTFSRNAGQSPTVQRMKGFQDRASESMNAKPITQLRSQIQESRARPVKRPARNPGTEVQVAANGIAGSVPDWHVRPASRPGTVQRTARQSGSFQAAPIQGNVMQLKPSTWKVDPNIVAVEKQKSSGFFQGTLFSTWAQIKERVAHYDALKDNDYDNRYRILLEIRPRVTEWLANPKHAAGKSKDIDAMRKLAKDLDQKVDEELEEVALDEDAKLGANAHPYYNHGPDLTDDQLKARLQTGKFRPGQIAGAVGAKKSSASSGFDSRAAVKESIVRAIKNLDDAKAKTQKLLTAPLRDYGRAWTKWLGLKGNVNAEKNVKDRFDDLENDVKAIKNPTNNVELPLALPLVYLDPATNPAGLAMDTHLKDVLQTFKRYVIELKGAKTVGRGFEKEKEVKATKKGWDWKKDGGGKYVVNKSAAPTGTLTVLDPGKQAFLKVPAANTWPVVTHYPMSPAHNVEISAR